MPNPDKSPRIVSSPSRPRPSLRTKSVEISFTPVDNQRLANLCGALDERSVQLPRLVPARGRLVLAYLGYGWPLDAQPTVLLAESPDEGRTWRCLTPNGALDPTGLPPGSIHTMAAFDRDGTPALLVEWLAEDGSDLWLAEAQGALP